MSACPGASISKVPAGPRLDSGTDYVQFESRGVVMVCGPASLALAAGKLLAEKLRVVVCTTDTVCHSDLRANPLVMRSRIARIGGYLGRFKVEAWAGEGRRVDMAPFSGNPDGFFDLVLDLNAAPLLDAEIKPPGYHAPEAGPQALAAAIADLMTLTGTFRKPVGIHYDEAKCAHSSQGVPGCTRCLAVCPAGAISSEGQRITVAAELCRGCATCAMVCPTGALSTAGTAFSETVESLTALLGESGIPARLVIHDAQDTDARGDPPPDTVFLALPAVAVGGIELWLAALALGVPQVVVQPPPALPASSKAELVRQVTLARALLAAIGELPNRLAVGDPENPAPAVDSEFRGFHALPSEASRSRRALFHASLDRLLSVAPPSSGGAAAVELPEGIPSGAVEVENASCTLCMACANVCPTGALRSDKANFSLGFVEGDCIQCRLCEGACPEGAISLKCRLLLDPDARHAPRTLKADDVHHCPGCGAPFTGQTLLRRNMRALNTTGMLNAEGLARLHYCPGCRRHGAHGLT